MSKPFSVSIEVGGQELEVSGRLTKAYPATLTQPEEPSELEVEQVELLVAVVHDSKTTIDITDLVEELGGNDLIQTLVDEAYDREDIPDED